ncbi:MAG: hypothetical protein K2Y37_21300 [Pirellulales bacterium]|nr:hypothetical protein [Pirellulales bacterium]
MRDELVGYLVGALEPHEHAAVEDRLRRDPQLHDALCELRGCLAPLGFDGGHFEPPAHLVQSTCDYVADRRALVPWRDYATSASGRFSVQDLMTAAGVVVAASLLFFPAVNYSRGQAEIAGCQNSLRQLASAMLSYSNLHDRYFPHGTSSTAIASTGMYAPILHERGFVKNPRVFVCPAAARRHGAIVRIPTLKEVEQASPAALARLEETMGGDYRTTLGYIKDEIYHPVRNAHREYFAILSDAPGHDGDRQSPNHGGLGQNVLFDDGHAQFMSTCRCRPDGSYVPATYHDNIFSNDHGDVGFGLHADDSVIARGHFRATVPVYPASSAQ